MALILAAISFGATVANAAVQTQAPVTYDARSRQDALEHRQEADRLLEEQRADAQRATADALNTRITDINARIGDVSLWLGGFAVLVTLSGLFVSFLAISTAGQRARESAEQWISSNTGALERQLDGLRAQAGDVKAKLDALTAEAVRQADTAKVVMETTVRDIQQRAIEATEALQQSINAGVPATPSPSQREALAKVGNLLRMKPESTYGAVDWSDRAFAAYADGKLALAAEYFQEAAQASNTSDQSVAENLFNRGVALSLLDQSDSALAAYNEITTGSVMQARQRCGNKSRRRSSRRVLRLVSSGAAMKRSSSTTM